MGTHQRLSTLINICKVLQSIANSPLPTKTLNPQWAAKANKVISRHTNRRKPWRHGGKFARDILISSRKAIKETRTPLPHHLKRQYQISRVNKLYPKTSSASSCPGSSGKFGGFFVEILGRHPTPKFNDVVFSEKQLSLSLVNNSWVNNNKRRRRRRRRGRLRAAYCDEFPGEEAGSGKQLLIGSRGCRRRVEQLSKRQVGDDGVIR